MTLGARHLQNIGRKGFNLGGAEKEYIAPGGIQPLDQFFLTPRVQGLGGQEGDVLPQTHHNIGMIIRPSVGISAVKAPSIVSHFVAPTLQEFRTGSGRKSRISATMVMVQNHATRPFQELPLVGPIAPIRFVGHPIPGFDQEMSEVVSFFESS